MSVNVPYMDGMDIFTKLTYDLCIYIYIICEMNLLTKTN